jgi:hypothetical protein
MGIRYNEEHGIARFEFPVLVLGELMMRIASRPCEKFY